MTQPTRTRQPSPPQQAYALSLLRLKTPDGYVATRRALLALAATVRQDRAAYTGVVLVMADVRAAVAAELAETAKAAMRDKRNPPGDDPLTRWYAAHLGEATPASSPNQQQRELSQRQNAVIGQLRQRDAARLAANALAHALWAVHQGARDWTPLATKPSTLQAHAPHGESPSASVSGPAYLEVAVPSSPFGPAHALRLFRMDYERLLEAWGYHRVARASRLREKLRGTGAGADDVDALFTLALDASAAPNLARAWHGYIGSGRLGDVFRVHGSGTVQLSSGRSGDLREAVMELHAQCAVVAFPVQTP